MVDGFKGSNTVFGAKHEVLKDVDNENITFNPG